MAGCAEHRMRQGFVAVRLEVEGNAAVHRLTEKEGEDGMMSSAVRPYVMDLGSTNGTFLNNERLDSQRYYELYEKVRYHDAIPHARLGAPVSGFESLMPVS